MQLSVLCVDGLDPDYAKEIGYPRMPYESKMDIPKTLYHNNVPHTQLVWPSMLSGKCVTNAITNLQPKFLKGIRLPIRKFLHSHGIKWLRDKKNAKRWGINPSNVGLQTVADDYNSVMWNVPTICPEFVCKFPSPELMLEYGRHEYRVWKIISFGMCFYNYELNFSYCHLPDILGHLEKPLKNIYLDIHYHARTLSKYGDVMLVSDHGCIDGEHTEHAYLGCTKPVRSENVLDVRDDIVNILSQTIELAGTQGIEYQLPLPQIEDSY